MTVQLKVFEPAC